jgi:photosystem II stability/assembly factor-like uncharacterized protein
LTPVDNHYKIRRMAKVSFVYSSSFRYLLIILSLVTFLCLLCCVFPVSASLEPLRWTKVNIPATGEAGGWELAGGSDIRNLTRAADGTLYASVQGLTDTLYRSTDGGISWSAAGNARDSIVDVAISPRDINKVYYATTSTVYRSVNTGKTFTALPSAPGGAGTGHIEITSLDVGGLTESMIAVGTRDTDNSEYGGVYILDESNTIPSWVNTGIGNYDVYAVAFSPNYNSDFQLIVVTSDETDTLIASKTGNLNWNAVGERAKLNRDNVNPPIPLPMTTGSAVIAFPDNYNGDPASETSIFYVAVETGTGQGDIYSIKNSETPAQAKATDLNAGQKHGANNIDFSGLAAAGNYPSTTLVAGEADSPRTITSTDGGLNWTRNRKEPSGTAVSCLLKDASFAATGRIYAATTGANSAFSVSLDSGATWNQISLIDSTIDIILDLATSPHFTQDSTIFMLTFGNGHSLWRSRNGGTNWERILTYNTGGVDTLKMIGLPPCYSDDSRTIFAAGESNGKPAVWQSTDDGQSYRRHSTYDPVTSATFSIDAWVIIDNISFIAGSYDGNNGIVYLTTNSGFTYSEGIPAGSQSLNSLAISPFYNQDGIILAGNTNGWVYILAGNGTSFHPLPGNAASPPLTGSIVTAFDPDFKNNHIVYAASDSPNGGIYRINTATGREWEGIDSTLPAGATINHLVISSEGTLYASNSKVNGGMERCLYPAATANRVFERVTNYLASGATLMGLWQSGHQIWSIDTTNNNLLTYQDTLTDPITPVTPGEKASGIGSISSHTVRNIVLDWNTLEGATTYQWQADFNSEFSSVSGVLGDISSASSVRLPALEPATTYYWRVRATGPVLSPWSEKRSFTTSLDTEANTLKPESPAAGATGVAIKPSFQWTAITGASAYELLAADNPDFANPVIIKTEQYALPTNAWQCDVGLNYHKTYYWKVRAISESTRSSWSSTGLFTTEAEPTADLPSIIYPGQPDSPPVPTPAILAAPLPVIPAQTQTKPDTSSPPQEISPAGSLSQPLEVPAWVIYLIFFFVATIILALFTIMKMISKIKR